MAVEPGRPPACETLESRAFADQERRGADLGLQRAPHAFDQGDAAGGADPAESMADAQTLDAELEMLRSELHPTVGDEMSRRPPRRANRASEEAPHPLCGRLGFGNADRDDGAREGIHHRSYPEFDAAQEAAYGRHVDQPDVVRTLGADAVNIAASAGDRFGLLRTGGTAAERSLDARARDLQAEEHEQLGDALRAPGRVRPAQEPHELVGRLLGAAHRRRTSDETARPFADRSEPLQHGCAAHDESASDFPDGEAVARPMPEDAQALPRAVRRWMLGAPQPGTQKLVLGPQRIDLDLHGGKREMGGLSRAGHLRLAQERSHGQQGAQPDAFRMPRSGHRISGLSVFLHLVPLWLCTPSYPGNRQ